MNRLSLVLPLLAVAAPLEAQDRTAFVTQFDRVRVDGPVEVHLATRAGPGARIVGLRVISSDRMATCAIAQGLEE